MGTGPAASGELRCLASPDVHLLDPAALDPHVDVAITVLGKRAENCEVGVALALVRIYSNRRPTAFFPVLAACTNIFPAIRSTFFCGKEWLCGPCGAVLHHWGGSHVPRAAGRGPFSEPG